MGIQFNYFNCLHSKESNYEEAYKMAVANATTQKRASIYINEFLKTDFNSMLIPEEKVYGTPLSFRTWLNHTIHNYDIKGVKAVVRKGHVYLIRDSNMA